MARVTDFITALSALSGVDGYVLAQSNGQILSHNLTDAVSYLPWAKTLIQRCTLLSAGLNNDPFRGVSFQSAGRFIHLFPIRQYHLVVLQPGGITNPQLFQHIEALIQETVERG